MKKIVTEITHIGDPFVLLCGDTYYMYATSAPDGIKVFTATDLDGKWTAVIVTKKAIRRSGTNVFGRPRW